MLCALRRSSISLLAGLALLVSAVAFRAAAESALPERGVVDVVNPERGFYTWYGTNVLAAADLPLDRYFRFSWAQLEPERNKYDFGEIERQLRALPPGVKFSFRVMAMNVFDISASGMSVPRYISNNCPKGFFVPLIGAAPSAAQRLYVPDWNCEAFLSGAEQLLLALGKKYDGDPRIGWVDIGIYGHYGEWHLSGLKGYPPYGDIPYADSSINERYGAPGTVASRRRLVDAHVSAFPHTPLLMMTDDTPMLLYALSRPTSIPIGLRRDSFGMRHFEREFFARGTTSEQKKLILDRWRVAPFIVETASRAALDVPLADLAADVTKWHISAIGLNTGLGRLSQFEGKQFQEVGRRAGYAYRVHDIKLLKQGGSIRLRSLWENEGSAPVYEPWDVTFNICGERSKRCLAPVHSQLRLESVLPDEGPKAVIDMVPLPTDRANEAYKVSLVVRDPRSYRLPLKLFLPHQKADGSYELGTFTIDR